MIAIIIWILATSNQSIGYFETEDACEQIAAAVNLTRTLDKVHCQPHVLLQEAQ